MNEYREERINMIIAMMMAIANISEETASALLKSTITYQNIIGGEECTLYESYSANLEDVVEELQECNQGDLVKEITEDAVTELNKWMLDKGIKNARQLKENADTRNAIIAVASYKKAANRNPKPFEIVTVAGICRRKKSKAHYRIAECKAGKTIRPKNITDRAACLDRKNSLKVSKKGTGWKVR